MMFFDYLPLMSSALLMTLVLAVCSLAFGLVLAIIFVVLEDTKWRTFNKIFSIIVALLRGLPEILVVFLIYFGLPEVIQMISGDYLELSAFSSGIIALGIIFASYACQTLRGAVKAIPRGQSESAQALGLSKGYTFIHVILPQVWRHALPGLSNQWLVLLKDTALVSLIGVTDLTRQAQLITTSTHQPFTWYVVVGLIYLLITLFSQAIIKRLESYFTRFDKHCYE